RELWAYRELVLNLTLREVKVRYKQTVFGMAWVFMQPIAMMVIFSIIFGRIAKLPTDGFPYPVFVFAGLVPWQFFSSAVARGSDSLVGSGSILKQVYFPRLGIPLAAISSAAVDFCIALGLVCAFASWYGYLPTLRYLAIPFVFGLALVASLGVSLVLSAMNVQFRDVKHAAPFLIQIWMYATPVVYPLSMVKDGFLQILYGVNPMVGVIEGFRWALLGTVQFPVQSILVSLVVSLVLLVIGVIYFKRMERTFADVA
ncbi:MAG: ABC transporter permease, partial [Pseudomonadales bacterium]|nr:ABC transporter permease [Pseudomonadales bacterium]